jgi:DNA-directed RNA polymerase specialized sigma24 family protein
MADQPATSHLSQITTLWSVVCRAHAGADAEQASARAALIERYGGAVYRYLLTALKDRATAEDLSQEFALRFVRGDFKNADPEKGRFRNFVKSSLYYLVVKQRQKDRKQAQPLTPDLAPIAPIETPAQEDVAFLQSWRDELLARAWKLLQAEQKPDGPPFYDVLRVRAEQPSASADELTIRLSEQVGRDLSATHLRQLLHRARERFAGLLINEAAESLDPDAAWTVEDELIELGLWEYCKDAANKTQST